MPDRAGKKKIVKRMSELPFVLGVKVRLYPSDPQKQTIRANIGAQRFVYNRLVGRDREIHALRKVKLWCRPVADRLSYLESLGETPRELQNAYPFLAGPEIDAQAVANGVKNYHTAWSNFHKVPGTSIPAFHKKGYGGSYQTNPHYRKERGGDIACNVRLSGRHHVLLPKIGRIRFADSGRLAAFLSRPGVRIGTITVSEDACGDFYAAFQAGADIPFFEEYPDTGESIGIDVNVKNYYAASDGTVVDNPAFYRKSQERLARDRRKLSRRAERAKKEGRSLSESRNYQKQRLKTAKTARRVARQRRDFLHRISKDLVKSHDRIYAEDLKVRNLLKNHCLAKSVSDCAWAEFFRQLGYKSVFYGREFRKVPPHYTTQTCSSCGHILSGEEKLGLDVRAWTCPSCGSHHDRDINAAINIKNLGLALSRSGIN